MQAPEVVPFLDGHAAVVSLSAPDREGVNEDAAALIPYDERSGLLVVADGAGGTRGGGEAARLVVENLVRAIESAADGLPPLRAAVLNALERANAEIADLGTGAATTVVIMQVCERELRPYHAGDSICLVVGQRGRVRHKNIPHGPVGYAVEAGLLDSRQAMVHEERHLVSNFVGREDMRIEVGPRFASRVLDTVLVASDGLSDNLYTEEIVERIRKGPLDRTATALLEACRSRMRGTSVKAPGKPDDLTFILFRHDARRRSTGSN
jgi:serine/threonine protein phosphatase PrpC